MIQIFAAVLLCVLGIGHARFCPASSSLMQDSSRNWCYWFITESLHKDALKTRCQNDGGLIFTIEDSTVQSFVESISATFGAKSIDMMWVNYHIPNSTTFEGVPLSYTNFNVTTGSNDCVGIQVKTQPYTWQRISCEHATGKGICYKVLNCPPQSMFVLSYDLCFWTTTVRKTALEGHYECMASGGGLAVIPNDAVNEEIKKTHNSKIETAHSSYGESHNVWLGVNDICTEGVYETFEGVNATYLSWMSGQPNDKSLPGDLQDCTIARLSDSLDWHDKDCTAILRISLCSKNLNSTDPPALNVGCLTTTTPSTTTSPTTTSITATTSTTTLTSTTSSSTSTPTTTTLTTSAPTTTTLTTSAPTTTTLTTTGPTTTTLTTTAPSTTTIATTPTALPTNESSALNCLSSSVTKPRNETVPLDQITEKIKKEMLIDVKTTSAYKRSLVCAEDPRPSSQYIGATAASMMVVIGCAIILPDLGKVVMAIVKFFSN